MYNDCCYTKDDYNAMCDWNLNPSSGQSMSYMRDPYGNSIPVNVFMQVPKNLYFSNSKNYCCHLNQNQKIVPVNYLPKDAFFSNSRYYCCMGNAKLNYNNSMANSMANYGIAKANNFGSNCCCGGY